MLRIVLLVIVGASGRPDVALGGFHCQAGYLVRRLIAADFESVPADRFTWPSFLISSLLFGAMHQRWVAGTSAGMLFARRS